MKRRFLLTIGFVVAAAIGAVGILQYLLFRAEQFRLIDNQIEVTASLLISSDLTTAELKEFDEVDGIVTDVIGGDKLNLFVIVFNRKGDVVYRSANAQHVPENLPLDPKWQTYESEGHFIRLLTVPLEPDPKLKGAKADQHPRMLQTGIILDDDLVRWKSLGRHVLVYSILVVILILLTTMVLSQSLLRPLVQLAEYLRFVGSQFDEKQLISDELAKGSSLLQEISRDPKDEFSQLAAAARQLQEKIRTSLKLTQTWTAQMAHELKTPLTVLRNSLEAATLAGDEARRRECIAQAVSEVSHLNMLINSFLEWTAAENFPVDTTEVHAIKLKSVVEDVVKKFGRTDPDRIRLEAKSDVMVFAKPGFVHQAVSNLIQNAIRYSPAGRPVDVHLDEHSLTVMDDGPGLPSTVLDNLGQPFNYGQKDNHGFGIGLAWVSTICRKYDWRLSFERVPSAAGGERTVARILFPEPEAEA